MCKFLTGRTADRLTPVLGGLFSGNVAVIHSVLGEITDSTNQATAFPLYGLCWPLGGVIGYVASDGHSFAQNAHYWLLSPLMGGLLSNPATKFSTFDIELFRRYPYLLPCIAATSIAWAGCIYGYFYLTEVRKFVSLPAHALRSRPRQTLPSKRWKQKESIEMSERRGGDFEKQAKPASIRYLLSIPVLRALCISGAGLSFM